MSLAISIPEKKISAWMAETTVPGTHTWLSQLPIADSRESARDLYQALYTLNRMELGPKTRMGLMELYRLPVSQVTGQLSNRIANASYPLSAQRIRLAEFIRDLHVEMAYGFKLALFDIETGKGRVWGKSGARAKAVFRSLHYLGNVILRSAHNYLPYPDGIWKEVHSLYEFAENNRCLDDRVAEIDDENNRTSSVSKRYKEILLLGLADPYQMPQGQCKQVNGFVYRWAELVDIKILTEPASLTESQYLIRLNQNLPAVKPVGAEILDEKQRQSVRVMDVSIILDNVASMIRRIETGTPARNLELGGECLEDACTDMLERLIKSWTGSQKRHTSRISMKGPVSVCSGLGSIHYFAREEQKELLDSDGSSKPAVLLSANNSFSSSATDAVSLSYKTAKWEIIDASADGALIRGFEDSGVSARVGELIAFMDAGVRTSMKLFVVRWLRETGQKGLEVGLELMSSDITSILVGQERGVGGFVPGLMLNKIETDGRKLPRTMVLQKDLRGKQKDIELIESGKSGTQWVRVLEVIDKTNTFERLSFINLSSSK